EQVFGPVNLRRLADDAGAALSHQQVGGHAEGRVGGHAAVAVGAAAVGAEDDLVGGEWGAAHVVDLRQQLGDGAHARVHGFADAAALLDREDGRLFLRAV